MTQIDMKYQFNEKLRRPTMSDKDNEWAFLILPKSVSAKLPRRGRSTVEGTINGQIFQALLEPDGQLSHWFRVNQALLKTIGAEVGDIISIEITPVAQEPEPEIPPDLKSALVNAPDALVVWNDTTTIARLDWIHWISTAKKAKTREKRINDACDMLAKGKRRVCCFDQSGFYSKALSAPKEVDEL